MTLQTAVQGRARQAWDRGLERVEAVVERQQRVPAEGHDHGFLLQAEGRRVRLGRAHGPGAKVARLRRFCTVVGLIP